MAVQYENLLLIDTVLMGFFFCELANLICFICILIV